MYELRLFTNINYVFHAEFKNCEIKDGRIWRKLALRPRDCKLRRVQREFLILLCIYA